MLTAGGTTSATQTTVLVVSDDLLRFHGHCFKSALIADGVSPVGLSATEGFSFTSAMSWPFACSCVPFAGPMLAMDCATGGFATT